jgi:protein gp37
VTTIEWTRGDDGAEGRRTFGRPPNRPRDGDKKQARRRINVMNMAKTSIEWTEYVWNCVRGCSRTSPGCGGGTKGPLKGGCYAEAIAERFSGPGQAFEGFAERGKGWTRKVALVPEKLAEPLSWRKSGRVFANSMSDLFHEELSNEDIAAVFGVMAAAPHLTFQVLTKRAQRMHDWFAWARGVFTERQRGICAAPNTSRAMLDAALEYLGVAWKPMLDQAWHALEADAWPLPNVHLGVSVEDQQRAEERVPLLLETPAEVRWLSCEPLLGPLDLNKACWGEGHKRQGLDIQARQITRAGAIPWDSGFTPLQAIDWCVVGGESGHGARPFDLAWARAVRDQCVGAGVPYFFKQAGARASETSGLSMVFTTFEQWSDKARSWLRSGSWTLVDARGRVCVDGADMMRSRDEGAFPVVASPLLKLKSKKGGDLSELPADLRVREMPEVRS